MKIYEKNEIMDLSIDPVVDIIDDLEFSELLDLIDEETDELFYERFLLRNNSSIRKVSICH